VNNKNVKAEENYTGEELFEAIFFGYGKASNELNEYWDNVLPKDYIYSNKEIKKIKTLESKLKKTNPKFFKEFKKSVESGDPLIISETFKNTEASLAKVFEKEISIEQKKENVSTKAVKPGVVVGLAYAYVGVTHVAAAFVLTVVAVGTKVVGPKSIKLNDSTLNHEMYVNTISEAFKK